MKPHFKITITDLDTNKVAVDTETDLIIGVINQEDSVRKIGFVDANPRDFHLNLVALQELVEREIDVLRAHLEGKEYKDEATTETV